LPPMIRPHQDLQLPKCSFFPPLLAEIDFKTTAKNQAGRSGRNRVTVLHYEIVYHTDSEHPEKWKRKYHAARMPKYRKMTLYIPLQTQLDTATYRTLSSKRGEM
jgi:hypothetical protein